jgi:hypothetical protein
VLALLRNVIQHRPRIRVVLAGSHTFKELARWATYLINAQTVHVGYLDGAAARQLVEQPVQGFQLQYEPPAVDRVLAVTRGHPALLQLLCSEIIVVKNSQPRAERFLAKRPDVEAAVPRALASGALFFADLETNRAGPMGAAVLRALAERGEGGTIDVAELESRRLVPDLAPVLASLLEREVLEQDDAGRYRFQVELIRCWFARPESSLSVSARSR